MCWSRWPLVRSVIIGPSTFLFPSWFLRHLTTIERQGNISGVSSLNRRDYRSDNLSPITLIWTCGGASHGIVASGDYNTSVRNSLPEQTRWPIKPLNWAWIWCWFLQIKWYVHNQERQPDTSWGVNINGNQIRRAPTQYSSEYTKTLDRSPLHIRTLH